MIGETAKLGKPFKIQLKDSDDAMFFFFKTYLYRCILRKR